MSRPKKLLSASHWADRVNRILDSTHGNSPDRYRLNLIPIIKDLSATLYPGDRIERVIGEDLPNFDGCLVRKRGNKNWDIIYNNTHSSTGRIRFTLAHEFGHFLLHRKQIPDGVDCAELDTLPWLNNAYHTIEHEANKFAALLLMPKYDFCQKISPWTRPTLDLLSQCAKRYEVSLTATILHWINLTKLNVVVVLSRDGYILWSRSSEAAFRSGIFFRTTGTLPIPLPKDSLPMRNEIVKHTGNAITKHAAGIWFESEPCEETTIVSHHYDFVISVLFLKTEKKGYVLEEESSSDSYDELIKRIR